MQTVEDHAFMMDTFVTIHIPTRNKSQAAAAMKETFHAMQTLSTQLDRYETSSVSLVSQINQSSGEESVSLPETVINIFHTAQMISEASDGAFDLSIGVVVDLWRKSELTGILPSSSAMSSALSLVDYKKIYMQDNQVFLEDKNMSLDLGAIAKGAIADLAKETLQSQGIERAILDAGGNIVAIGSKTDQEPWSIGIANPNQPTEIMGYVEVTDLSVVTAGIYQRAYEINGERYHHILSTENGYPTSSLKSVTILHPSSLMADALSTAVMVLGPDNGLSLIESYPGTEAIIISADDALILSKGAEAYFTLLQKDLFHEQ